MKFIDPQVDFAFKKIFGSEETKDILISFLNAVLGLDEEHKITEVTIMNPYQAPRIRFLKYTYLDVKCKDINNIEYVIEMQVVHYKSFDKRVIYNASKAYVNQLESGEKYIELNQVIAISVLNFVLFEDFEHYLSCHRIQETITNKNYLDEIRYYFIELPKFNKKENELENNLEKWTFFLKNAGKLDYIPHSLEVSEFEHAFDIASKSRLSPREREEYDANIDSILVENAKIESASLKGEKKGIIKGEKIGIEKNKKEIAKAMLKANMDIKTIANLTGLSEEEIKTFV